MKQGTREVVWQYPLGPAMFARETINMLLVIHNVSFWMFDVDICFECSPLFYLTTPHNFMVTGHNAFFRPFEYAYPVVTQGIKYI